jgi:hypothetical protein
MKSFREAGQIRINGKRTALRAREMARWLQLRPLAGLAVPEDYRTRLAGQDQGTHRHRLLLRLLGPNTDSRGQTTGDHIDLWNEDTLTSPGLEGRVTFFFGSVLVWRVSGTRTLGKPSRSCFGKSNETRGVVPGFFCPRLDCFMAIGFICHALDRSIRWIIARWPQARLLGHGALPLCWVGLRNRPAVRVRTRYRVGRFRMATDTGLDSAPTSDLHSDLDHRNDGLLRLSLRKRDALARNFQHAVFTRIAPKQPRLPSCRLAPPRHPSFSR